MKSPQKVIQTKLLLLKKCTTLSYSGDINEYAKNMKVNASEMIVANGSKKEIDINELHTLMFLNSLIDHFQASITLLSDEEKQSIDKGARIPQENEITLTPPSADHAFTVNKWYYHSLLQKIFFCRSPNYILYPCIIIINHQATTTPNEFC